MTIQPAAQDDLESAVAALLRCPICGQPVRLSNRRSIVCPARHTFDLAKHGYINLLTRPARAKYDKRLFQSRKAVLQSGLYDPLHDLAAQQIARFCRGRSPLRLLDAGSGEGTHLASIRGKLTAETGLAVQGVGIDLAKEGAEMAARSYPELLWCVGDLARSPLGGGCFDAVLNILSPANYEEFGRLLKPGGIVLKVIPEPDYLIELRRLLRPEPDRPVTAGSRAKAHFRDRFAQVDEDRLRYRIKLERPLLPHLAAMTPLSWQAGEDALQRIAERDALEVTVDLAVLIGRNVE
jgi:Methylase involved in ubiquinone/menaquinone biosynthesis